MRILSVHDRYRSAFPSGEDRVVDQETAALAAAGHEVERLQYSSDDISRLSLGQKAFIPIEVVWNDSARRSLISKMRCLKPDVVHVHNTFPRVSASVLYACRAERVPIVASVHNYNLVCASGALFRNGAICHDCVGRNPLPGVAHGCYRNSSLATLPLATNLVVHRRAWRRMVSAYVFLSRAQRDIIAADGLPAERIFVKPNFVARAVEANAPRHDVVVYAGRLSAQKGLPLLMEAWDRYCPEATDRGLKLVLAGSGPLERQVASWAEDRPSVEWVGMLPRDGCASLLASARAVIVPSAWEEPFGLVVVEAMAAGVPPLAPAHGAFPELIADGVDGVLFPPRNPEALARLFHDVERSPARYTLLGRRAKRTYERRFTPEANVAQLLTIYEFAIKHPAF